MNKNNSDNKSELFETDNNLFSTDELEDNLFQDEDLKNENEASSKSPNYEELVEADNPEDDEEQTQTKKLSKEQIKKIAIITGIAVVGILLIVYIWGVIYFKTHFEPNTMINGVNVSYMTHDKALEAIDRDYEERKAIIEGVDGEENEVTGAAIDLKFNNNLGDLDKLLEEQNTWAWPGEYFDRTEDNYTTDYTYNKELLDEVVTTLPLVSGPNVVPPKDASISYNGSEYVIVPSENGDTPDVEKLIPKVLETLVYKDNVINLKAQDLYLKPSVTTDNPTLEADLNDLNTAIKASITLTFPTQNVTLNKDTFESWIVLDNNKVYVNNDSLTNYVADLANRFDTAGRNLSFTTTNGSNLTFRSNSGWVLNQQAQINTLRDQILDGTVTTEEPQWSQKGSNFITGSSISGTYIEVSLGSQAIWYYKNGTRISSSSIVSGDVDANQSTVTGLYSILSKDTNVALDVKYPDGTIHNMTVNYWLPFTNTYGFEGATWRDQFGGDIYKTQGTDGDIDIPETMAKSLYDNVDVGTPVVIYN